MLSDLELFRCSIHGCSVGGVEHHPEHRPVIRNVRLERFEHRGNSAFGAVFENVVVDGLRTHNMLQLFGRVFRHVVLRGKIGTIMTVPDRYTSRDPREHAWTDANAAFYAGVDWALDIREAEVEELDLRGVPASLVLRDPDDQVVVKRSVAQQGRWRSLDLSGTYWGVSLDDVATGPWDDLVLVAARRDRKHQRHREALRMLRAEGIAEPD